MIKWIDIDKDMPELGKKVWVYWDAVGPRVEIMARYEFTMEAGLISEEEVLMDKAFESPGGFLGDEVKFWQPLTEKEPLPPSLENFLK